MEHEQQDAGVEPEGINAVPLIGMVFAAIAVIAVISVIGAEMAFSEFAAAETAAIEMSGYPVLMETRAAAHALLATSEVIDAENGIYRIPISQAMSLVSAESGAGATTEVTLTR